MEEKKNLLDEVSTGTYNAADKPFDFVDAESRTALLCVSEEGARATLVRALQELGYRVTESSSARDALKSMRFHTYDLICVDERFDTDNPDANDVLRYLGGLAMATRRQIFVTLLGDRYRTMDNMAAFHRSVNLTLNLKNLDDAATILKNAVLENASFFQIYRETLKKVGRA